MRRVMMVLGVIAACGGEATGGSDFGDAPGEPCTPGEQRACACPGGGPDGAQICTDAGDRFGACFGCVADESTGDPASSSDGGSSSDDAASVTQTSGTIGSADSSGSSSSGSDPTGGIPDDPPQAVPPAPPPDGSAIVNQVAAEHPELLAASCVDTGGNNEFLFEVARRLRESDDRWGLNWKRGVVGDLSQDVVDYHYGEGVSEGSTDVYIIDIIGGHCGDAPQAAWIDVTQATLDGGTVGMWTLAGQPL